MMERKKKQKTENAPPAPVQQAGVHLVWGNDEYFVREHAQKLVNELCPPANQALALEVIDGDCDTIDPALAIIAQCLEGIRTVGFMGMTKVVWLRNATFFYDGKPGMYADVKKAVVALTDEIKQGLPPGQYLVISAMKVDRRSAFYKACQARGRVEEHSISDKSYEADRQAAELLAGVLAREKLVVNDAVQDLLLQRIGTDSRQIIQEISKLSVYLGARREVREDDVRAVVCASREAAAWDLTDAVGRRDLPAALHCLRQLASQKAPPIMLVVMLQNRFRELIVLRECLDRRWLRLSGTPPWRKAEWQGGPDAWATSRTIPGR
jgi:DNA polymerase III delta subunit